MTSNHKKNVITTEAKVGVFVIVLTILMLWASFTLSKVKFFKEKGYKITTYFDNVQGLTKDSSVMIAGIKIGKVNKISLNNNVGKVDMLIKPSVKIKTNSVSIMRTKGFLGDKFIEIIIKPEPAPLLKDGDTLKYTLNPPDFEKMINDISEITLKAKLIVDSFSNTLGGTENEKSIKEIFDNFKETMKNLNYLTKNINNKINKISTGTEPIIDNLNSTTAYLNKTLPDMAKRFNIVLDELSKIVKNTSTSADISIKQIKESLEQLTPIVSNIKLITEKIDKGEGTVGQLINDDTTIKKINSTLKTVDDYVQKVNNLQVHLNYHEVYQFGRVEDAGWATHFSINLKPDNKKSYIFGIVDYPTGDKSWKTDKITTTYPNGRVVEETISENIAQDKVLLNVQYARNFGNLTIRGGLIQSSGGGGFDYHLLKNRINFTMELFDFTSNQYPYLRTYLSLFPTKYIYLSGGASDYLNYNNRPLYTIGGGITFTDEDFLLILSRLPSISF